MFWWLALGWNVLLAQLNLRKSFSLRLSRIIRLINLISIIICLANSLKIRLLFHVRMLLNFLSLFLFIISPLLIIVDSLLHLLLHIYCESRIFGEDLLLCHLETLEKKICLCHADFVWIVLSQVLARFQFKVFFVLGS